MSKALLTVVLSLLLLFNGCDKGISPEEVTGFSGTISFIGEWPDSIARTHLVVFENPLNSINDFNPFNLRYVSLEIPYGTRIYKYNSADSAYVPISAGSYSYVAVAQSKKPVLSLDRKDWFVAGLYYSGNDMINPGKLIIPENTMVTNINIIVDFNNPPPQPPGGN
ncbi:MAG TPA: hypothetical protein VMT35_10015 [Ignavibacteriaceae bacterium]|nr:hypothetical protein [Ignavibacteriaceae bacterium]